MEINTVPTTAYEQAELFVKTLHENTHGGFIFAPKKYRSVFIEGRPAQSVDTVLNNLDFSTDNYVSVNEFASINGCCNRLETSCALINGVFIDLDLHDGKSGETEILKVKSVVDKLELEKKIPVPTFVINTGRGLALHYIYKERIHTENITDVATHKSQYRKIFIRFKEVLGDVACVDTTVRDLSRVCRIPGTFNSNAGVHAKILEWNNVRYTLDELRGAFDLDNVVEVIPSYSKKKNSKRAGRPKKYACEIINFGDIRPAEDEYTPSMRYRATLLETWIEECGYECSTREVFLFVLMNTYLSYMTKNEAADAIREMNNKLAEPLDDTEINGLIRNMVKRNQPYPLTNESITNKLGTDDWMQLGSYKSKRTVWKKYEPKVSKEERAGKYALIHDAFNNGMSQKEISKQLDINISTVSKITKTDCKERRTNRDEIIWQLYGTGMTAEQIAKEAGCCRRTVFNVIKKGRGTLASANFKSAKNAKIIYKSEKKEAGGLLSRKESTVEITTNVHQNVFDDHAPRKFLSPALENLYKSAFLASVDENEKKNALDIMIAGHNVCLLGSGGTGKSTLVRKYYDDLDNKEKDKTLLLAYTGKAAKNLPDGKTIHSALHLPVGVLPDTDMKKMPIHKELLGITRVIIDEIGIVRGDIFNYLMKAIRKVELWTGRKIQVIVTGDFGQIRPVATSEDLAIYNRMYAGKSLYCFDAPMWKKMGFEVITLRHVERQNEPALIEALNLIKYGNFNALKYFNSVLSRKMSKTAVYICPTNELVRMHNSKAMSKFKDIKLYPAVMAETKTPVYACETLKLAVGMRVMATRNNKERYQNGSTGTVVKLERDKVTVLFDGNAAPTSVLRSKYDADGKEVRQFPLQAAYAITVDKAQGMTFDEVNIIPGYFAPGQLYVALTRCKTLAGMHISRNLTAKDLIVDEKALAFGLEVYKHQNIVEA